MEVEAIADKTASTILKCLYKFISDHGVPEVIVTDQGREFCNELNDGVCTTYGIKHRIASPYHPQTGGRTERYNRTQCSMLSSCVNDLQIDWDTKLPFMLFAYRTAQHETTKKTPFSLVYGREARLPIELDFPIQSIPEIDNFEGVLKQRCDAFIKLSCEREEASKNIKQAQQKQKKHHDKIKNKILQIGDNVLLHNSRKLSRKGGKLEKLWSGPYTVEAINKKGTYTLQGLKCAIKGNRLKLYKGSSEATTSRKTVETQEEGETQKKDDDKTKGAPKDEDSQSTKKGDTSLPLKKRKIEEVEVTQNSEPRSRILFYPTDNEWQVRNAAQFDHQVKQFLKIGRRRVRHVNVNAIPTVTASMRGDGNCLFRTFSYILFGVQSYHNDVRNKVVDFMKKNKHVLKKH